MNEQLAELMALLKDKTEAGSLEWEDLRQGRQYRANVGNGFVRIARVLPERPESHPIYTIVILEKTGRIAERRVVRREPDSALYAGVAALFDAVHSRAAKARLLIEDMIRSLKRTVPAPA